MKYALNFFLIGVCSQAWSEVRPISSPPTTSPSMTVAGAITGASLTSSAGTFTATNGGAVLVPNGQVLINNASAGQNAPLEIYSSLTGQLPGADAKGMFQMYNAYATGLHFGGYTLSPYGWWIQSMEAQMGAAAAVPLTLQPLGGGVGIGTYSPVSALDVNGNAQFGSGATKSAFAATGSLTLAAGSTLTANGYGLSNSTVFASTEPAHTVSITTDYVCVATVTVTNRGSRVVEVVAHGTIVNAAGGSRDYTYSILRNGVSVTDGYVQTNAGTSTGYVSADFHSNPSVAGTMSYCLAIKSSSTGTQTIRHLHITSKEFP